MENKNEYVLKNVSEDLINMYVISCMKDAGMCMCDRCQADVRAFALNNFPPHYVVTNLGDALIRASVLSSQFQVDIITAIMKGILVVKDHPRHDKYDIT